MSITVDLCALQHQSAAGDDANKVGAGGGGAEEVEALKRAVEEARVQAVRLEEEMLALKGLVQEERAKVEMSKGGVEGVDMQSAMETLLHTASGEKDTEGERREY